MHSARIIYWEQDGGWIGYLGEYPDYWTQGKTLDDLRVHLRELYRDLTSGEISGIRRCGDLII
jgi:predicted RNase H-like HicB family nuclease